MTHMRMSRCGLPTSFLYTGPEGLMDLSNCATGERCVRAASSCDRRGGIGGLTAALALRARGLKVAIFEQAVELGEIGAGISIHANAALLLQRIHLTDSIKKIGVPISGLLLSASTGRAPLTSLQAPRRVFKRYNVHRAEFRKLLTDAQPKRRTSSWSPLVSGQRNRGPRATNVREWYDRRERISFIGADGIHSILQRAIGLKTHPSSEGDHGL